MKSFQRGGSQERIKGEISYTFAQLHDMVLGGLRWPFLSWISEFPTHRISMSVNHWHPKPVVNPETSKKE
jgi:hypothetical protein